MVFWPARKWQISLCSYALPTFVLKGTQSLVGWLRRRRNCSHRRMGGRQCEILGTPPQNLGRQISVQTRNQRIVIASTTTKTYCHHIKLLFTGMFRSRHSTVGSTQKKIHGSQFWRTTIRLHRTTCHLTRQAARRLHLKTTNGGGNGTGVKPNKFIVRKFAKPHNHCNHAHVAV